MLMLNDVLLQHLQQQLPLPDWRLLPGLCAMVPLTTFLCLPRPYYPILWKNSNLFGVSLSMKVHSIACGSAYTSAAFLAFLIFALTLA